MEYQAQWVRLARSAIEVSQPLQEVLRGQRVNQARRVSVVPRGLKESRDRRATSADLVTAGRTDCQELRAPVA
jgi:hypothetical protein